MCSGNCSPCDCSLHSFQYRYCTWDTGETEAFVRYNSASSSFLQNDNTCVIIPLLLFFLYICIGIYEKINIRTSCLPPIPDSSIYKGANTTEACGPLAQSCLSLAMVEQVPAKNHFEVRPQNPQKT